MWNTNNVYAVSDEGIENKMSSFRKAIIARFNIITFFAGLRVFSKPDFFQLYMSYSSE